MLPRHARRFASAMRRAGASIPATLTVVTTGARTVGALAGGKALTRTDVPCRGNVSTWSKDTFAGTLVQQGDRMVHLFGATLGGSVPKNGDYVTIDGEEGRIVAVDRDGAAALYMCLVRV